MISKEQIILTFFGIGFSLIIIGQLIFFFMIAPVLYAHGSRLSTLFTTFAGYEIPKYKEICIREGKSLVWYELYTIIGKFISVWAFIFVFSLIVFVFISLFIVIAKIMNQSIV